MTLESKTLANRALELERDALRREMQKCIDTDVISDERQSLWTKLLARTDADWREIAEKEKEKIIREAIAEADALHRTLSSVFLRKPDIAEVLANQDFEAVAKPGAGK